MLLYCVRHGESAYNVEGRLQGQSDIALSPLGRLQAKVLAETLARLPIEAVYSSPLARARETAAPIAAALGRPLVTDARLMEIDVGIFQGLLLSEIGERHPREAACWGSQDPDYRIPRGESRRDLMVRGAAAFEAIREAGHPQAVVVAHGGLLAAAFKALLEIPAHRNPFSLYNASISTLRFGDGQVKLLALNQTKHLRAAGCELTSRSGEL